MNLTANRNQVDELRSKYIDNVLNANKHQYEGNISEYTRCLIKAREIEDQLYYLLNRN